MSNGSAVRVLKDRYTQTYRRTDGTDFIPSTADTGGNDYIIEYSTNRNGTSICTQHKCKCNLILFPTISGISLSELEGIASYPTDQTVMTVNSFDDVKGLANKLAEGLCDSKFIDP